MENRASHVVVGAFVLGLVAALAVLVVWLGGFGGEPAESRYRIYFTGAVTGLSQGNPVRYRGIPVGHVQSLRIDPEDMERIEAVIAVQKDTPIKTDTIARIDRPGVTGTVFVQLSGGSQEADWLRASVEGGMPEIPSEPSTLEQIMQSAPGIAEDAKAITSQLKELLNSRNRNAIDETLQNMRKLSSGFAGNMQDVETMIHSSSALMEDLRSSVASFKTITASFEGNMDAMRLELVQTMQSLRQASNALAQMSKSLNTMVNKTEGPVVDFASSGLYEITQLTMETRELIVNLNRISQQFERDPARFLFGDAQKGFEVDQ